MLKNTAKYNTQALRTAYTAQPCLAQIVSNYSTIADLLQKNLSYWDPYLGYNNLCRGPNNFSAYMSAKPSLL